MRRGRGEVTMTASTMSSASLLLAAGVVATGIRLIQRRLCTARLRVGFLVVGYVRYCVWGWDRVHSFCQNPVFYLDLFVINYLSHLFEPFFHPELTERAFLDLLLKQFGHGDRQRLGTDHSCRDCVNALRLGYTLAYSLLHCGVKGHTLKTFVQGSINHCLDHGYDLRIRTRIRGSARISKESYDSFFYQIKILVICSLIVFFK